MPAGRTFTRARLFRARTDAPISYSSRLVGDIEHYDQVTWTFADVSTAEVDVLVGGTRHDPSSVQGASLSIESVV